MTTKRSKDAKMAAKRHETTKKRQQGNEEMQNDYKKI